MLKEGLSDLLIHSVKTLGIGEYFIPTLFAYMILILLYSTFIFYFYRFFAKKQIFNMDLEKYKNIKDMKLRKTRALGAYLLKHFIILPVISLFWFAVFAIFLILLSKELTLDTILLISASFVAAVRVSAYIDEQLSQDLAKMLPLTLLALMILGENFFSIEVVMGRLSLMPLIIPYLLNFILFIVIVEVILRIFTLFINSFKMKKDIVAAEIKLEKKAKKKKE